METAWMAFSITLMMIGMYGMLDFLNTLNEISKSVKEISEIGVRLEQLSEKMNRHT